MYRQRWYQYGQVFGMRYLFEQRGDGLAMHAHPAGEEHNVLVVKGAIQVVGRNPDGSLSVPIRVDAPAIIDVLPPEHELVALLPATELLNLYAHGIPTGYAALPESERDVIVPTRPLAVPVD